MSTVQMQRTLVLLVSLLAAGLMSFQRATASTYTASQTNSSNAIGPSVIGQTLEAPLASLDWLKTLKTQSLQKQGRLASTQAAKTQTAANRNTGNVGREVQRSFRLKASGYNSHISQTDNTPHVTATGARTRFGVVALSRDMLRAIPYGSRVRLEDMGLWGSGRNRGSFNRMLGNTVFIVEDTMHPRKSGQVDVWFYSRGTAMRWGIRQVRLTVMQYGR